jgi:hypothetical protein
VYTLPSTATLEDLRKVLNVLLKVPLLDGVAIEGVALTTTAARVAHKLGRPYRGFLVTARDSKQHVYEESPASARPQDEIWLVSSADVTVDLWVY